MIEVEGCNESDEVIIGKECWYSVLISEED